MTQEDNIRIVVAEAAHEIYVDTILATIEEAAKKRGTGIAKRTHEYVATKMKEAKAILALDGDKFAGFSYIETWGNTLCHRQRFRNRMPCIPFPIP